MKFGVIVFPGSNCDHDCYHVLKHVLRQNVRFVWHKETSLKGMDCIILPGGFSYGDYLRTGAMALHSPVMGEVKRFARRGGLVLGICNGFQILLESGLLPGAMLRNRDLKFVCRYVHVRLEEDDTPFTSRGKRGQVFKIPVAHNDGNYFAPPETLQELRDEGRIVFRYCLKDGHPAPEANPNGSLDNIAGICNEERNVLGMMPHPERCAEGFLGSSDGRFIFESMLERTTA
jgi:phosphoribosylformylglycinamidine synthase